MKRLLTALAVVGMVASAALAWDTSLNPDRSPSLGWAVHGGHLPGFTDEYARFTEFGVDLRLPVSNYFTVNADFAQTTVSNAPTGVSTEANRYGAAVRVYFMDLMRNVQ